MAKAVQAELDRVDWGRLRCGCGGSAEHVPELFRRLLEAETDDEVPEADLEGHLIDRHGLFEAAVPGVGVILAALAGPLPDAVRRYLVTFLWHLVAGDPHPVEVAHGRTHLDRECQLRAREGLALILREAVSGERETAVDILELVDLDGDRVEHYRRYTQKRRRKK
ncbi:hypothetical protein SUDANB96_06349 [Streptomyces sp. enrichment culture]